MTSPTFAATLAARLRTDPAQPLVTFYDDATGERVELSVTTYANWVAKTAGLIQDELDVERGGLVLVDLPTHWLAAVWLGAAWTVGATVTDDLGRLDAADLLVCGPDRVDELGEVAAQTPVVGLSLRPLGARFDRALPTGVVDYGAVVLGQPDAFAAYDPPEAADCAWADTEGTLTQAELLALAGETPLVGSGGRLLTDTAPSSRPGLLALVGPLVAGGGTVWVRHPDPASWSRRFSDERATAELRAV